ncbi:hypothetical protein [Sinosporangium album]|uniref:hypothetical protein n=1 Tax=Sinosporangium album TaxID=504805 RepID=UPI000B83E1AD|nr:hypothetical protein [Sinosporangium album]
MDKLVPNPRHRELQEVLQKIQARGRTLERALDQAVKQFAGGSVWVGPSANRFGQALTHHRKRLRTTVDETITQVEAELKATDREVHASTLRGGYLN